MMARGEGAVEPYWSFTMACLAGPCLWAVHFAAVYGASHFACQLLESSAARSWLTWWVPLCTLVIGIVLLALLMPGWFMKLDPRSVLEQNNKKFMELVARGLVLLSLFGVVWAGITVLFLPACSPR